MAVTDSFPVVSLVLIALISRDPSGHIIKRGDDWG